MRPASGDKNQYVPNSTPTCQKQVEGLVVAIAVKRNQPSIDQQRSSVSNFGIKVQDRHSDHQSRALLVNELLTFIWPRDDAKHETTSTGMRLVQNISSGWMFSVRRKQSAFI